MSGTIKRFVQRASVFMYATLELLDLPKIKEQGDEKVNDPAAKPVQKSQGTP